jgi:CheY-like chemotaxis protein
MCCLRVLMDVNPTARAERVLVVDDDQDSVDSMAMLLELDGYTVATARTGRQAIDVASSFQPTIVFCDIGLPGLDGYAVARALRAHPALGGVRLIALTGYGYVADEVRAHEAGFDEHLLKPVDPETLVRLITAAAEPEIPTGL